VYSVITESPLNPSKYREKTIETLFELFNLEGVYLASKCLLSLYSTGRITGCVVESGHGVSYSVPIYEGYTSPHNINKLDLGGKHLDIFLNQKLFDKGYEFTTPLEWELISQIKEELCYIYYIDKFASSKESKLTDNEPKMYHLPDDSVVRLTSERHAIPEAIFDPSLINLSQEGIHKCCFYSIMKTNTEIRSEMFSNIVLTGGNTLFDRIQQRLFKEIYELAPTKTKIDIIANKERMYSSWIGGSIIGNMDTFQFLCVSRKEYNEQGNRIIHDKTL
jgi:actin